MTLTPSREAPPFLLGAYIVEERVEDWSQFPFNLPYVKELDLTLEGPVTLFVGENGSGKSTLLSALAELAGLPGGGGSRNELTDSERRASLLAAAVRPKFRARPRDGFFFRAESLLDFARILDKRKEDPDFLGDPHARYGGKSLRERSHGEGVSVMSIQRARLLDFDRPALPPIQPEETKHWAAFKRVLCKE